MHTRNATGVVDIRVRPMWREWWIDLRVKFEGLVEPVLGKDRTAALYAAGREFGAPGTMGTLSALLAGNL